MSDMEGQAHYEQALPSLDKWTWIVLESTLSKTVWTAFSMASTSVPALASLHDGL